MQTESGSKTKVGFAPWALFYPDNAIELYYLKMNYVASSVNYQTNPDYDGKAVLRTSFETTLKN
jgi:hypothetical protein